MQAQGSAPLELDPALAALAAAAEPRQHPPLYTAEELRQFTSSLDGFVASVPSSSGSASHSHSHSHSAANNIAVDSETAAAAAAVVASTSAAARAALPHAHATPPAIAPDGELPGQQPSLAGKATKDMTPAEKAANRKERNRLAAQKSRDKRQAEFDAIAAERDKWKHEAELLRARVHQLESALRILHSSAQLPDEVIPHAEDQSIGHH